jgi:hypothetical protein
VWEACRKPLSENGLAVIQLPGKRDGQLFVDSILTHPSGEWISSRLCITPVKDDPQAIGSAITYARRYGLQAIVGIAPDDDDGNAASGRDGVDTRQRTREDAARSVGREQPAHSHQPPEKGLPPKDWRAAVVHFGKHKGKTLGELEPRSLGWFQNKWDPQPFGDAAYLSTQDLMLKAAVDASKEPDAPADGTKELPGDGYAPKVKELSGMLDWNSITEADFMRVAHREKWIPETAMHFGAMSEETAAKFLADMDAVTAACAK